MSRHNFELRQGQQVTMTPALQQSIRLLQLSTLELELELANALADNPMLEQEQDDLHTAAEVSELQSEPRQDPQPELTADLRRVKSEDDVGDRDEHAHQPSLQEYLLEQLGTTRSTVRDAALIALLIEDLNEDGFLASPLEEIVGWMNPELGLELDDFQYALRLLQSFDPPGVAARDLSECLDLQLQFADPQRYPEVRDAALVKVARALCRQHLSVLASGNMSQLREVMHCDAQMLRRAHALVMRLNPRPGRAWSKSIADFVVPDVLVHPTKQGWVAVLNEAVVPRLRIHALYAQALGRARSGAYAALHGQLQEARWMIKSVAQRFDTILRVAQAIVAHQQMFFSSGWEAIRPLTLKDIAAELDLHESTVSRATTQKFMLTPFGTFELKRFFSTGLTTAGGESTSSTAIQKRIQALIGQEDRNKPLSDSQLVSLFEQEGITIARRTVAKYRELQRIPAAALRKSQAGIG
jgi:RNA polymerase sigma-54 factor